MAEKNNYNIELKGQKPIVISEVKRASPSKGVINQDFNHLLLAQKYKNAGANIISVLTDSDFFWGNHRYLCEIRQALGDNIGLLMKDFIIDPFQVFLAKALGASHILLIVKALSKAKLEELYKLSLDIGLQPLVEVHDNLEAQMALELNPELLGVNHRNLTDFSIDLKLSEKIKPFTPENTLLIAESGINSIKTCEGLLNKGIDGFLIGEWFNKVTDPGSLISQIKDLNGT